MALIKAYSTFCYKMKFDHFEVGKRVRVYLMNLFFPFLAVRRIQRS